MRCLKLLAEFPPWTKKMKHAPLSKHFINFRHLLLSGGFTALIEVLTFPAFNMAIKVQIFYKGFLHKLFSNFLGSSLRSAIFQWGNQSFSKGQMAAQGFQLPAAQASLAFKNCSYSISAAPVPAPSCSKRWGVSSGCSRYKKERRRPPYGPKGVVLRNSVSASERFLAVHLILQKRFFSVKPCTESFIYWRWSSMLTHCSKKLGSSWPSGEPPSESEFQAVHESPCFGCPSNCKGKGHWIGRSFGRVSMLRQRYQWR